jgi:hypothetical protein
MMENNNVEPAETNSSDQSHPNFEAATTTVATMPTVHTKPATSTRKVEANRKNSLKSTGPKTAAGKRRVSRNAVKFGLFSKYLLVPHADGLESQGELDELRSAMHSHFQPVGVLEEFWVEKIVVCCWRLRRALRTEGGHIAEHWSMSVSWRARN